MKKGLRNQLSTFTGPPVITVNNEGVERIFPLHSPFISKVTVKLQLGESRRAKLFLSPRRPRRQGHPPAPEKRKTGKKGKSQNPQSTSGDKPELAATAATLIHSPVVALLLISGIIRIHAGLATHFPRPSRTSRRPRPPW